MSEWKSEEIVCLEINQGRRGWRGRLGDDGALAGVQGSWLGRTGRTRVGPGRDKDPNVRSGWA